MFIRTWFERYLNDPQVAMLAFSLAALIGAIILAWPRFANDAGTQDEGSGQAEEEADNRAQG